MSNEELRPYPSLPFQVGPYRALKKLGQGGMGCVYLAEDPRLRQKFALKIPHPGKTDDKAIARFEREGWVAASIQRHPNLCPVIRCDKDEKQDLFYLAMHFIEEKPLSDLVSEGSPWEQRESLALVHTLARALGDLHQHPKRIIHRDLKPANVMIEQDGNPVVMDFGLVLLEGEQSRQLTVLGQAVGTMGYMPLEQMEGRRKDIGPATDVFSLGVILYELLTGIQPFTGTMLQMAHQMQKGAVPPSSKRKGLHRDLDPICLNALAETPRARYATMEQFAQAIEQLEPALANVPRRTKPPFLRPLPPSVPPAPLVLTLLEPPPQEQSASPDSEKGNNLLLNERQAEPQQDRQFVPLVKPEPKYIPPLQPEPKPRQELQPEPYPRQDLHPQWRAPNLPSAGQVEQPGFSNSIGMKFALIPKGVFLMGSPADEGHDDEHPQHDVEITRPFYMGIFQVTQEEYQRVMGKNPSYFSAAGGGKKKIEKHDTRRFPVESVSHDEVIEFCRKLSELPEEKKARRTYRLPTEAEWEYSCRGRASYTEFHYGANIEGRGFDRTCPVGSCPATGFGLYDMHGNVWEWCLDWFDINYYKTSPKRDPQGPKKEYARVCRGGSWNSQAVRCRAAFRGSYEPAHRNLNVGCRVCFYLD